MDGEEAKQNKPGYRCNECRSKLSLLEKTIGSCKCGMLFCTKHRMPESHTCTYDHKLTVPLILPASIAAPKVVRI